MNFSWGAGGPLFRYSDLILDPMTFISELDLDMVLIYHCAKKFLFHLLQKLELERTHRQTDRQTAATKTLPLLIRRR